MADQIALGKLEAQISQLGQSWSDYIQKTDDFNEEDKTKLQSEIWGTPYLNLSKSEIDTNNLYLIDQQTARRYQVFPLGLLGDDGDTIGVAMVDAADLLAIDFVSRSTGKKVVPFLVSQKSLNLALQLYDNLSETKKASGMTEIEQTIKEQDELTIVGSKIESMFTQMLNYAFTNKASDIHIEPMSNRIRIRCRIDGVLKEFLNLSLNEQNALISYIKIKSRLKIDEKRLPQDGQFSVFFGKIQVDFRIAISPTIYGEKVVLRLLNKSDVALVLDEMGYVGRTLEVINRNLERTNGIILTSGPTGSGKSTSMIAMVKKIIKDDINIVTLEDPVESKVEGANQIQINSAIGLTFEAGLRSILRLDPDVILVGEIRDQITAQLAIQAALTGHLVFSTVHTNTAAGILPRLLDMGIEPFLIASTVRTVIGQRLIRKLISTTDTYTSTTAEADLIKKTIGHILPLSTTAGNDRQKINDRLGYNNLPDADQANYRLYRAVNPENPDVAYQGRTGLYEAFEVSPKIQQMIVKRATADEIEGQAVKEGMVTMRQDGFLKALAGITTLNEVNRVIA